MAGYEALTKDDERINFLIDAKEKAKTDRIRIEDIPEDSMDFSRFQLERLVKRNQINVELEKIKTEKQQQLTRITSNDVETIVIDPHFQGHILRKHDVEKKDNKNSWDSSMDSKSSSVNTSMEGKSKEFESKKGGFILENLSFFLLIISCIEYPIASPYFKLKHRAQPAKVI